MSRAASTDMSPLIIPQSLVDNLLPDKYAYRGSQYLRALAKECGYG